MRFAAFFFILILATSCSDKIASNYQPPVITHTELIKADLFPLSFHQQVGSCESLPITHKVLFFDYIPIAFVGTDVFAGSLEILLDEETKTYQALYLEMFAPGNVDQTDFQSQFTGSFEVIKAASANEKDKMILNGIGEMTATINQNKISFILKLENDINRPLIQYEVLGRARFKTTKLVTDNCLL